MTLQTGGWALRSVGAKLAAAKNGSTCETWFGAVVLPETPSLRNIKLRYANPRQRVGSPVVDGRSRCDRNNLANLADLAERAQRLAAGRASIFLHRADMLTD